MSSELYKAYQELCHGYENELQSEDSIEDSDTLVFRYFEVFLETDFWIELLRDSKSNAKLPTYIDENYDGPVLQAAIANNDSEEPPVELYENKDPNSKFERMSGMDLMLLRKSVPFNIIAYEIGNTNKLMPLTNDMLNMCLQIYAKKHHEKHSNKHDNSDSNPQNYTPLVQQPNRTGVKMMFTLLCIILAVVIIYFFSK